MKSKKPQTRICFLEQSTKPNESQVPWPVPGTGKEGKTNLSSLKIYSSGTCSSTQHLPSNRKAQEGLVFVTPKRGVCRQWRGLELLPQNKKGSRAWTGSRIYQKGREGAESSFRTLRCTKQSPNEPEPALKASCGKSRVDVPSPSWMETAIRSWAVTSCVTQPSNQFGHPLPPSFMLWCQCARQHWATLPLYVHPLLHHHFAGKTLGAECLLMELHEHGRN